MSDFQIIESLRSWASEAPDDVAVKGPDFDFTAGELWDAAIRITGWLRQSGVDDSEAVGAAVLPKLHPAFMMGLLARGGVGSIVSGEIEVGPEFALQRLIVMGRRRASIRPESQLLFDDQALADMSKIDPGTVTIANRDPSEVVWQFYSSGTTGTPKAILRTASSMDALVTPRRLDLAKSRYFSLQPGIVSGATSAFLAALATRRTYLTAGDASENLQLMLDHDIEIVEGSPFQLDQLLTVARSQGEQLGSLREIRSAGAPLSPGLAGALADWFGAEVYEGYGSSEVGFVASKRVDDAPDKPRGGTIADDVQVEIVDPDGTRLPDGELGLIRMRAPGMATGYFGNPDLGPGKGFHDDWFLSGDLGVLINNELVVVGREDELMNIGGQKILPQRVEEVILQQPGIEDAVACAVTDRLGIRQLAIAIVGKAIEDPAEFARSLRGPLGGIQPSLIMRIARVPRSETGKPLRAEVARQLQAQLERPKGII